MCQSASQFPRQFHLRYSISPSQPLLSVTGLSPIYGWRQNARADSRPSTFKVYNVDPAADPSASSRPRKKRSARRPRDTWKAESFQDHLPFWNLLFPRPLCQGSTLSPLVGPPTSPRPPQPYADSPTSFLSFSPYFRSLLEHLGKARSLGNVKRHGQAAGSRSRDHSEESGGSKEHAQPSGKAACGRVSFFLALQLARPFPAARCEASREEQLL